MEEFRAYNIRKGNPDPLQTALLIIDMQEYFRGIGSEIIDNICNLMFHCRNKKIPVVYTQHGHIDPEKDGGMLGKWWGDLIKKGSPESEIVKELTPSPGDKIIHKMRYSAFLNTNLEAYLHENNKTDLIITGVMTNLCCETTARDAFVRDFSVFFISDGTATANDDLQTSSLKNLAYGFAYIKNCKEMVELL